MVVTKTKRGESDDSVYFIFTIISYVGICLFLAFIQYDMLFSHNSILSIITLLVAEGSAAFFCFWRPLLETYHYNNDVMRSRAKIKLRKLNHRSEASSNVVLMINTRGYVRCACV